MSAEPACKGKSDAADHPMIVLGACHHEVGDATYTYTESACPECGAIARRADVFACGTGRPAVRPTSENCRAMKWKADRAAKETTA